MTDTPDEPEQVIVIFKKPPVRPGTPEAHERGCLCRFESNMEAAFLAADEGMDETIFVIHKDCPIHKLVTKRKDQDQ